MDHYKQETMKLRAALEELDEESEETDVPDAGPSN